LEFRLEALVPDGALAASSRNAGARRCFGSFCWQHWFPTVFQRLLLDTLFPPAFEQLLLETPIPDGH
jgi:hypothetical protein